MNNDLISRSALKEDMKSRLSACNEWIEKAKDKETKIRASAVKAFIAELIMTIDNAPAVEPFERIGAICNENCGIYRPQGEWLEPYESHIAQECSICHRQMPAPDWFNFCPNCGADMRGGAE